MPNRFAGLLLGFVITMPLAAQEPAGEANTGEESAELEPGEFRDQLLAVETEVVSKSISLTTDEATKFWPLFQKFQDEQKAIIDGQIAAVREYASDYVALTDDDAVDYVNTLLERDQAVHDLRVKYLEEFSKVLPAGKAARVVHVLRRLGLAGQAKLASQIPLVR
jgi:hypothetical protein